MADLQQQQQQRAEQPPHAGGRGSVPPGPGLGLGPGPAVGPGAGLAALGLRCPRGAAAPVSAPPGRSPRQRPARLSRGQFLRDRAASATGLRNRRRFKQKVNKKPQMPRM